MFSLIKVYTLIIAGVVIGAACFVEWVEFKRGFNGPIQVGRVVRREPIQRFFRASTDFTIQIEGTDTIVHAFIAKKIAETVPDVVRFHYSGDPSKRVVLYLYEENMIGIVILFWGLAAALFAMTRSAEFRRVLGWV